jgi:hypothetical protein
MKFSKLVSKWQGSLNWWISVEPSKTWFYKGRVGDMPFPLYLAIADLKVVWYGDWGCDDEYVESRFEVRLSKPENEEQFETLVKKYGVKNNDV